MWFKKIDILLMGNLFEDQTSKNGGVIYVQVFYS